MNTQEETISVGAGLRAGNDDARKEAARLMGQARTEKKIEAGRRNIAKATEAIRGQPMSEEHKQALREAYARRATVKREEALTTSEPKRRGRPAKDKTETTEPKRGRGRPKKSETVQTAQTTIEAP